MNDHFATYRALDARYAQGTPEGKLPDELRCGYCGTRLYREDEWERGFCCVEHEQGIPRA